MTTPKSRAGRRVVHLGPQAIGVLDEQFTVSRYRESACVVFCHEALGTPLDPSKLSGYARKAFKVAPVKPFRPWHGLRHTALARDGRHGRAGDVPRSWLFCWPLARGRPPPNGLWKAGASESIDGEVSLQPLPGDALRRFRKPGSARA
jgi:hypothetical protein